MKTYLTITFALFILIFTYSQSPKNIKIKPGIWTAKMKLNASTNLPFKLEVGVDRKLTVINGEERIALQLSSIKKDTFIYQFPEFDSYIYLVKNKRKKVSGYWLNNNKTNYKVSLEASHGYSKRFQQAENKQVEIGQVDGKWEATFDPESENPEKTIGLFEQEGDVVHGTFLTETGDYRFLDGNATSDSLFISCFDGSHAFMFTAAIKENQRLEGGKFYSGKHWVGNWEAVRNDTFELRHPDSITFVKKGEQVRFTLKDLDNQDYIYPNEHTANKVVIIQLMGTWCPNCLDETRYFKELYDKYHSKGLEIISIGYEVGKSHSDYASKIIRFKDKSNLDFIFLVGGPANKGIALQNFPMLNNVTSFPTTLFIGKNGEVKRVHTGFNGPGTGEYYEEFKTSTEALIEELLEE